MLIAWISHLYAVEGGGPVVAADAVEVALDGAQLVGGAPAVHAGDGLPAVTPGAELLPGLETWHHMLILLTC